MEELSKVKLDKAPFVKNLFYAEKKPNAYYMVIAENNTNVNKGNSFNMKDFGRLLESHIIMLGLPNFSKSKKF